MLTKRPFTVKHTHCGVQEHTCRYTDPRALFWLHLYSNHSWLYLLTEEVMKENHTKPEVVLTEETRGGGATTETRRLTNAAEGK